MRYWYDLHDEIFDIHNASNNYFGITMILEWTNSEMHWVYYDFIKCTLIIEHVKQLFMWPHGTRLKLSIPHARRYNYWVERKEEFALQCVALLACCWKSMDSNDDILKVAPLFERHLNIIPVSFLKMKALTSLMLPNTWIANSSLASNVIVFECTQVLAEFGLSWWISFFGEL